MTKQFGHIKAFPMHV